VERLDRLLLGAGGGERADDDVVPEARGRGAERLPVDPDGRFGPAGDGAAYRIEFEAAARVFRGQAAPAFGRADAIEQAAVLEAVRAAAETRTTVVLPAAGA
jgi:predicted dehydrogenase